MKTELFSPNEKAFAAISCWSGIAAAIFVAVSIGDSLISALFLWLPQATVLGVLIYFRSPLTIILGTAIVLALYLAVFGWWLFSRNNPDSLAWLGYIFSMPGAAIGALVGVAISTIRGINSHVINGLLGAGCSFIGLVINQFFICKTVMHCGC